MIRDLGDRLRRLVGPTVPAPSAVDDAPAGDEAPAAQAAPRREEEFSAYAEDCRIFGFLDVTEERLSDALNQSDVYALRDVLVVALADGRSVESRQLDLARDEVIAVRAAGARGNPGRRMRRRPAPVSLKAGPYVIHGYVHTPPGADPIGNIRGRHAMVPLTGAWIEYTTSGQRHRARVGTIVVNKDHVEWVVNSRESEIRVDLPVEASVDPRAKDMTGHVRVTAPSGERSVGG